MTRQPLSGTGNLFQFVFTCTAKIFLLMFGWNILNISFCPLPPVLLLGTKKASLVEPLDTLSLNIYTD